MEAHTFRLTYKGQSRAVQSFPVFYASDIHGDGGSFNEALFRRDFDRAKERGARIYLNGDVFDAIMPQDIKRYARGSDHHDTDGFLNAAIEEVEERLAPYVDNIDMIGCGNHETAVLKYHGFDMTHMLIGFLNRRRSKGLKPIVHGGYTGFIRYIIGPETGQNTRSLVVYYNHGQGGSAEVTDGIIDAKRRTYTRSDVIWLGHKHKRWAHIIDSEIGVDRWGLPYEKPRWAIMTGSYTTNATKTDASANGYRLNYGEERMRTPQGTGGIQATINYTREAVWPEFLI